MDTELRAFLLTIGAVVVAAVVVWALLAEGPQGEAVSIRGQVKVHDWLFHFDAKGRVAGAVLLVVLILGAARWLR